MTQVCTLQDGDVISDIRLAKEVSVTCKLIFSHFQRHKLLVKRSILTSFGGIILCIFLSGSVFLCKLTWIVADVCTLNRSRRPDSSKFDSTWEERYKCCVILWISELTKLPSSQQGRWSSTPWSRTPRAVWTPFRSPTSSGTTRSSPTGWSQRTRSSSSTQTSRRTTPLGGSTTAHPTKARTHRPVVFSLSQQCFVGLCWGTSW